MDTNDNDNDMPNEDDFILKYQVDTKMFYSIIVTGLHLHSIEHQQPISSFTKIATRIYNSLCSLTNQWREDEEYKSDPRWRC